MKLALVGCAHIHTPGFVKRLNERTGVSVGTVWDHDSGRAAQNAAELGAKVVSDPRMIWEDRETPAVVICSETNRHEELVNAACRAKKHIFAEKPLGIAASDAFRMAEAIESAGVKFQTGYFMRGIPEYRFLRTEIREGHLGKITRIRMSNCHAGAIKDIFTPKWLWMTDPKIAGMGAFGDLGTHVLDIMLGLIDAKVTSVTATIGSAFSKYGKECDEYGEGLLEFGNGTLGSIAAGWVDVADPVKLTVSGTEGHAMFVDGKLYYRSEHVAGADGSSAWSALPAPWPHAFELFLDAIEGASPPAGERSIPLVSPAEAALRSDITEALYRAAADHAWVTPCSALPGK